MCSQPTPKYINHALKMGAHVILNRPYSTTMLHQRLKWVVNDKRELFLRDDRWRIADIEEALQGGAQTTLLSNLMAQMGLNSTKAVDDAKAAQALIDSILGQNASGMGAGRKAVGF